MNPPTIPGTRPGLSAILIAIKPANMGTMKVNAADPISNIVFQNESSGTTRPPGVFTPPRVSAIATSKPPTTINGTI
ncbi:hypothetical protein D3C78_1566570 [compost metagenome]